MKKRILSFILMLCIICSMLPATVLAAEVVDSGTCGDNLTWTLDDNGTLTISGSGEMWDFNPYDTETIRVSGYDEGIGPPPWSDYYASISEIEFSSEITYIGEHAFWGFTVLKSVYLPESLTAIGDDAFSHSSRLAEVSIPASVVDLGGCFDSCMALSKVTFAGDAPNCQDNLLEDGYEGLKILYHSSAAGWDEAQTNWVLPENTQWHDMDSFIDPEMFGTDQKEYILEPGESVQLTTNADPYTALMLSWSVEENESVFFSDGAIVTGIRPGTATVTVKSEDGVYCATCLITVTDADILTSGMYVLDGDLLNNRGNNNYTVKDMPNKSFIMESDDGEMELIQYNASAGVVVNRYSKDRELLEEQVIEAELGTFGGFFAGETYNFLLFGQNNSDESDDVEVLRIIKYSKDWERLDSCSVYGANTSIPFRAGTADFAETGGKLYLHTCHQMYASDDGKNHQANMTFVLDQETMEVVDSWYEVKNISYGYCSHSFSQRVRTTDEYVFRVDHGDAYPRSICLTRARVDGEITDVKYMNVLNILGETGDNITGVSLGGFELSSDHCLVVGNSVDQSDSATCDLYGTRNIFLCVADQDMSESKLIWLTDCSEEGVYVKTPQLVRVADDLFLVMWEVWEDAYKETTMLLVDGNGDALCEPVRTDVHLSDCQPIVTEDGLATWYTVYNGEITLYQVNWRQLLEDRAAVETILGHKYGEWYTYQEGTCVTHAVLRSDCSGCGIFKEKEGELGDHFFEDGFCIYCGEKDPNPYENDPDISYVENPFTDVKFYDYFYEPVLWAVNKGVTAGVSETKFGPYVVCTRAQVVTFLWRAAGSPEPVSQSNPFFDVKTSAYYYKAVLWAVENGITAGVSETKFGPNVVCTRAQVVTFLWRAAGSPEPETTKNPFTDVTSKNYYYKAVLWAVENGVTAGTSATTFGSNNNCTRAQIVTFLYKAVN